MKPSSVCTLCLTGSLLFLLVRNATASSFLSSTPSGRQPLSWRPTFLGLHQPPPPASSTSSSSYLASSSVKEEESGISPNQASSSSFEPPLLPLGGDFAGLAATFESKTGDYIPIPEHLVPKALLEWGQAPSALEVLVSEDRSNDNKRWTRQTITVLPETGCGVDNLETTKAVEEWEECCPTDGTLGNPSLANAFLVSLSDLSSNDETIRVEALFGLNDQHRSRVSVDIVKRKTAKELFEFELQTPVRIVLERQTATTSSHGNLADGGGLDGASVSRWLGPMLRKQQSFAERNKLQGMEWKAKDDKHRDLTTVQFPGNVTLDHGPARSSTSSVDSQWILQVGQIYPEDGVRQVVQWSISQSLAENFSVATWIEQGEIR